MTIIEILAIIGFFILFWIHMNTLWVPKGGRYGGFPNPVAVISLIQTIILGVYFIRSQGYMNKVPV